MCLHFIIAACFDEQFRLVQFWRRW